MKLVLASNNAKKLAELQALFDGLGVELVRQGELGVTEAEEPHITFIENALAKARHASAATGLPAIADDSGLCVDALGGMPGVISAIYATVAASAGADLGREVVRQTQDEANNALLLEKMRDVEDRRACFACTLVAIRSADDPSPLVAVGRWNGEILRALARRSRARASAKSFGRPRTKPTTPCCSRSCATPTTGAPTSRARWWRSAPPTTRRRWWPSAAGTARSCANANAKARAASATTR